MRKFVILNFINTLRYRLDSKLELVQVVLGARQVGKTTTILKFLEQYYPHRSIYASADDVFNANAGWLREKWQQAIQEEKLLVIDEIQKCFNWAEVIKTLFDESKRNKNFQPCILLGSSSLEIQRGLSESLTGRFQLTRVPHWNYAESHEGYGITFEDFLCYGGYPGSYQMINSSEWFDYVKSSIVSTVVEKDILQFNKVKNPALFRQAFDLLMSYPAQEVSYTKLLGQLQDKGNVELIKHYISLYEGAYLLKTLEKFSTNSIKMKASSPKIIPLAPALSFLQIRGSLSSEERGRMFEALVGAQLIRTGEEIFYWRDGKHEVDFVLKKGKTIWAIEVKSGRRKHSNGLGVFKEKFPDARLCVINPENYFDFERNPLSWIEQW